MAKDDHAPHKYSPISKYGIGRIRIPKYPEMLLCFVSSYFSSQLAEAASAGLSACARTYVEPTAREASSRDVSWRCRGKLRGGHAGLLERSRRHSGLRHKGQLLGDRGQRMAADAVCSCSVGSGSPSIRHSRLPLQLRQRANRNRLRPSQEGGWLSRRDPSLQRHGSRNTGCRRGAHLQRSAAKTDSREGTWSGRRT